MKIGLFGGAFDPIHKGHLSLAKSVVDKYNLDRLVFIPSQMPPHKKGHWASGEDRFNMISLSIKELGHKFTVSDIELKSKEISYTYNTLESWHLSNPTDHIYFICGSDIFASIESWHCWQEMFQIAKFIVVKRKGFEFENILNNMDTKIKELIEQERILFFDTEIDNISSSHIRKDLGIESCLVPHVVLMYIENHKLYEGNK